ncbi:MAG TPA: hypothetical protein VGO52_18520 [Hyphomonadaceae bacterium]|jgi:hypothetical protein|nr:hypothetical protein [Hyphomonadaceae bacterium]
MGTSEEIARKIFAAVEALWKEAKVADSGGPPASTDFVAEPLSPIDPVAGEPGKPGAQET